MLLSRYGKMSSPGHRRYVSLKQTKRRDVYVLGASSFIMCTAIVAWNTAFVSSADDGSSSSSTIHVSRAYVSSSPPADADIIALRPKGEDFERIDEKYLNSKEFSWWISNNLIHETLKGAGKIEVVASSPQQRQRHHHFPTNSTTVLSLTLHSTRHTRYIETLRKMRYGL